MFVTSLVISSVSSLMYYFVSDGIRVYSSTDPATIAPLIKKAETDITLKSFCMMAPDKTKGPKKGPPALCEKAVKPSPEL